MSASDDHALLQAWRAGDQLAGDTLVRRHFGSIYAFFRGKAPQAVDELVQHTFLACVEAAARLEAATSFRAYLFGIARRQLIYHYRRAQRELGRFDPMVESVHDADGSPSRLLALRQAEQAMLEVLSTLPLDLQITLELHYWEGMSVAEIGHVLEVPPGTVKSRMHRARELLRAGLEAGAAVTSAEAEAGAQQLRALGRALQPGADAESS